MDIIKKNKRGLELSGSLPFQICSKILFTHIYNLQSPTKIVVQIPFSQFSHSLNID